MTLREGRDIVINNWVTKTGDEAFRRREVFQILLSGKKVTSKDLNFLKGVLSEKGFDLVLSIVK